MKWKAMFVDWLIKLAFLGLGLTGGAYLIQADLRRSVEAGAPLYLGDGVWVKAAVVDAPQERGSE